MPELPEVEVVKKSLTKSIKNTIIKKIIINTDKLRYKIDKITFKKLNGSRITSIYRRSKYLFICLDCEKTLLVHLGMTGKFIILTKNNLRLKTSFYHNTSKKDDKHNHIYFYFKNDLKLIYNDIRKFGFIKIIKTKNILKNKHVIFLGPEPLSKKFNEIYFKSYIKRKEQKKIKDLLMDQKFVSGLGNIYVNEILFLSKISPIKKIKDLSTPEIKKIIKFTKLILKKSIKEGGSSIKNFSNSYGSQGKFQQFFNVYGKEGEKCTKKNCKRLIKKITVSNRSSFFCDKCQK